jgi:hypothetical protein
MSKVVDSLLKDAVEKVKTPEFHSAVLGPLLEYILDMLSPYLLAIVGLWVLTFLGVVAILGFLYYILT